MQDSVNTLLNVDAIKMADWWLILLSVA